MLKDKSFFCLSNTLQDETRCTKARTRHAIAQDIYLEEKRDRLRDEQGARRQGVRTARPRSVRRLILAFVKRLGLAETARVPRAQKHTD